MPLPLKWLVLDLVLPSMLYQTCQLSTALALRHSRDPRMRVLQTLSGVKIPFREFLEAASRKSASETAQAVQPSSHLEKLDDLHVHYCSVHTLQIPMIHPLTELSNWSKHLALTSPSIANYARKALIRCLPTNSNLHLWGRTPSNSCPNCTNIETENHVLNHCSVSAHHGRYTWQHNAVLKILVAHIHSHLPT